MKRLRVSLPGRAMPHYMIDIPGGHGKVPVNDSYIREEAPGRYVIEDPNGVTHKYKEC